jgi:drug/metabolite transporter (DMT)-like permease
MWTQIISKVLAESLLSLYPVFVKNIHIPLHLQLWSRFFTYISISAFFVDWGFIKETIFSKNGLLLSFVTIIHVFASYRGFQLLESGIAYTLFYTYPLMILLLASKPLKPIMVFALIGVILLSFNFSNGIRKKQEIVDSEKEEDVREGLEIASYPLEGYLMIALAAFTEALIYFIVRSIETTNNWNHLFLSYFIGTFVFSFIGIKEIAKITLNSNLTISILINSVIGLFGYLLQFYAATRLSPTIYAPLSYVGIVMSFVYGFIFNGEQVSIQKIIGTLCILLSIYNTV